MTDRYSAFLVTYERNIREDDAKDLITALSQIRGVIGVEPVKSNPDQEIAQMRANSEWVEAIYKMVNTVGRG